MKRFFILLVVALIAFRPIAENIGFKESVCYAVPVDSTKQLNVKGEGIMLMDVKTGRVLYEQNSRKRMYPASTTKILTALVALEFGGLDDIVTVGSEVYMIPEDASSADLKAGQRYKLRELIMALMLPSGNDAAYAVAVYIGRKYSNDSSLKIQDAVSIFVELMNKRAKEAGAKDSRFVNPHGYHDDEHYSTAYDIGLIAREAMKNETFKEVVKMPRYEAKGSYGTYRWMNTNLLINPEVPKYYYPFATGMKTGYTSEAGFCLVSSALKEGVKLISVVLNSLENSRWVDSKTIFEYGFNNYGYHKLINKDDVVKRIRINNHSNLSSGELDIISSGELECLLSKTQAESIHKDIVLDESLIEPVEGIEEGYKLNTSIYKDQPLGKIIFSIDGNVLGEIPLKSGQEVMINNILDKARYFRSSDSYPEYTVPVLGTFITIGIVYMLIRASLFSGRR